MAWRRPYEFTTLYGGLMLLGVGCLLWTAVALPLQWLLPKSLGTVVGRRAATYGFRIYLSILHAIGAARFDLSALGSLRDEGALIIVANHPGLLDAPMVLSRLPNIVCVLKASLIDNPLWGAGARLAGYIRNDWFIGSINLAVEELKQGSQLLLFPEGTRSAGDSLEEFRTGPAYISYRTGVPIQMLIIEQDNRFLCKGLPILRHCPRMPMNFQIRLGARFDAPSDPRAFTKTLQEYFSQELNSPFSGDR